MSPQHSFQRNQDQRGQDQCGQDQSAQGDRSVGQDLDNIFRLTAALPAAQQAAAERARATEARRVTQPELDAALDMLNRAAKAMDLMQTRYQDIEDYAKGVAERAEKDIATAFAEARDWEARAAGSESRLDELRDRAVAAERRVAGSESQLEALRDRAAEAERRAAAAERTAKEARDWLECFYDKIVSSFDTRTFLKAKAA